MPEDPGNSEPVAGEGHPSEAVPARRARHVTSRQLPPGELHAPRAPGADAIATGALSADPSISPRDEPVLDPTRYGRRHRKQTHALRYRLAQAITAATILSAAVALICVILGDRLIGQAFALAALLTGLLAMSLAWSTRLSARVFGYALVAAILAALALSASLLLPAHWFEDDLPDQPSAPQAPAPRPRGGPSP